MKYGISRTAIWESISVSKAGAPAQCKFAPLPFSVVLPDVIMLRMWTTSDRHLGWYQVQISHHWPMFLVFVSTTSQMPGEKLRLRRSGPLLHPFQYISHFYYLTWYGVKIRKRL